MKKLLKEATRNTPLVLFDPSNSTFLIAGNSMPENAIAFYEPVIEWLDEHLSQLPAFTRWEFRISYFNTSSMKGIYRVLACIKACQDKGARYQLIWDVVDDDEFMHEAGLTFQDLLGLQFEFRQLTQEQADEVTEKVLQA